MNIDLSQIIGLFFNKFKAIKEKINSIEQIHEKIELNDDMNIILRKFSESVEMIKSRLNCFSLEDYSDKELIKIYNREKYEF